MQCAVGVANAAAHAEAAGVDAAAGAPNPAGKTDSKSLSVVKCC